MGTRIDLEFPITILVGKNGSGKSSTLHALYGAPYWKSCSDFWFSTEVDPIEETGGEGKNRFFYGYREDKQSEIKEVMKTRMRRGSRTKEEDPDYWETSKPVKKIEEAQEYSLILLDELEVSIHPGAQEKLKEYLLEVTKRKKLQIVISSHSPILIRDMPSEAIKLYRTNSHGKFEIKEDVDYREAFYDLEDCVSDKKIIFCEDFAAKNIVEQVLKRMDKTQYFDVEFNHGGEKTLLTKYLPTFVTHDFFKERVFLVLDGDMQTDYVYNADELTVKQEKDVSYMKECVKKAYGVDVQAYVDGGNGGKREDQEVEAYKEYLRFYFGKSRIF